MSECATSIPLQYYTKFWRSRVYVLEKGNSSVFSLASQSLDHSESFCQVKCLYFEGIGKYNQAICIPSTSHIHIRT